MIRLSLFVAALLLATTGCEVRTWSSTSTSSSSSSSYNYGQPIGGACGDSGDCQGSAVCATNYPGGYCFMTCTNNASICPSNSMCVRLRGNTASQCYQACDTAADCRAGYYCSNVSNSSTGICLPN